MTAGDGQAGLGIDEMTLEPASLAPEDMVAVLEGERGVMLGLLRELLAVVETIEPESDDEGLRLWVLRAKTTQLLLWASGGVRSAGA